MTVSVTPWAIDGNVHPAAEARAAMASILGATGPFNTAAVTADPAHGIVYSTDLKVAQNGTPNMSVNVAAGAAFVRSGEATLPAQTYHVRNDGTVNLAIGAADATNPRKDLIVLQVRDSNFSGANDDARLFVVQGTPAASPSDPSLASTPNALVLARVDVPALDTAITNSQITDLRVGALGVAWWLPRGRVGRVTRTTNSGAFTTIANVLDDLVINTVANRRYVVHAYALFSQAANAAAAQNLVLAEGAGNTQHVATSQRTVANGTDYPTTHVIAGYEFTGTGSTMTFRLRGVAGSSAIVAAGSNSPAWLEIIDVGAVVA